MKRRTNKRKKNIEGNLKNEIRNIVSMAIENVGAVRSESINVVMAKQRNESRNVSVNAVFGQLASPSSAAKY